MASTDLLLTKGQEPLRGYLLHHLSAVALAQLRQACKAAQVLVDRHTGTTWKAAASQMLDAACLPVNEDGLEVQAQLRKHGRLAARLLSGMCLRLLLSTPNSRVEAWLSDVQDRRGKSPSTP